MRPLAGTTICQSDKDFFKKPGGRQTEKVVAAVCPRIISMQPVT